MCQGTGLVSWELVYTKHAQKDAQRLSSAGLKVKTQALLATIRENPFQNQPPYQKLVGDLSGAYSRRINIQHRLVYQVLKEHNVVKVLRMWSHYQ
jgi:toxin YoeB